MEQSSNVLLTDIRPGDIIFCDSHINDSWMPNAPSHLISLLHFGAPILQYAQEKWNKMLYDDQLEPSIIHTGIVIANDGENLTIIDCIYPHSQQISFAYEKFHHTFKKLLVYRNPPVSAEVIRTAVNWTSSGRIYYPIGPQFLGVGLMSRNWSSLFALKNERGLFAEQSAVQGPPKDCEGRPIWMFCSFFVAAVCCAVDRSWDNIPARISSQTPLDLQHSLTMVGWAKVGQFHFEGHEPPPQTWGAYCASYLVWSVSSLLSLHR